MESHESAKALQTYVAVAWDEGGKKKKERKGQGRCD